MEYNKGFINALKESIREFDFETCCSLYKFLDWEVFTPELGRLGFPSEESIKNIIINLANGAYKSFIESGELTFHYSAGIKVTVWQYEKGHEDYIEHYDGFKVLIEFIAVDSES